MLFQIIFWVYIFRNPSWYQKKIIVLLHTLVKKFCALNFLWSLALVKISCNNINNNRAQVSGPCYGWREESITADPEVENPISEDSKKTLLLRTLKRILSMRNLMRTLITVKPKDNAINEDPQLLQDPQWLLRPKLALFGFLVMLYDRVYDGDKFSKKDFSRGRLSFHATSYLKIQAKVFFCKR